MEIVFWVIIIPILFFLIFREIFCWYYKTNAILSEINQLKEVIYQQSLTEDLIEDMTRNQRDFLLNLIENDSFLIKKVWRVLVNSSDPDVEFVDKFLGKYHFQVNIYDKSTDGLTLHERAVRAGSHKTAKILEKYVEKMEDEEDF